MTPVEIAALSTLSALVGAFTVPFVARSPWHFLAHWAALAAVAWAVLSLLTAYC